MQTLQTVQPTVNGSKKKWTYQDYLTLGEEVHCQVLEGELIMTPAPNLEHQRISRKLEFELLRFVEERSLGEVFDAPVDVILDDENVVQPDLVFIAHASAGKLGKRGIMGAPDLVVEITSRSSLYYDRHQKKALYVQAGVKEYWLVDPANRSIEVFFLAAGQYQIVGHAEGQGSVASKLLEGFAIDVTKIMPGEPA